MDENNKDNQVGDSAEPKSAPDMPEIMPTSAETTGSDTVASTDNQVATAGDQPLPAPGMPSGIQTSPKKSIAKKKLIIIVVIIVLIFSGGVFAYLSLSEDNKPAITTSDDSQNNEEIDQKQTADYQGIPDTIAYAFAQKTGSPYGIFWRLTSGGDRTDAKLSYVHVIASDVNQNQVVAVASEKAAGSSNNNTIIIYSDDAGKTYSKIYDVKPSDIPDNIGDQITSIKISNSGEYVVFGLLVEGTSKNDVTQIKLSDKSTSTLFVSERPGVFINGYDDVNKIILYSEGCFQCDGTSKLVIARDIVANKTVQLFEYSPDHEITVVDVSNDFSAVLAIQRTTNKNKTYPIGGHFQGAPYTLLSISTADAKQQKLLNFGKAGDEHGDVELFVAAGYLNDGMTPYYAYDKQLFGLENSDKPSLLFESAKSLHGVYFASSDNVVYSTGTYDNFSLGNFSIKDKKDTNILSGDVNTIIFGVTTK